MRLLRTHFLVMRHASEVVPHPRLFVYNHTLLETFLSTQSESALQEWAFGRRLRGDAWGTDTWATAAILVYKLHQHPEWITRDPALADLFVIPLVPRRPTYNAVVAFEGDFKGEVRENCNHLFHDNLAQSYAHLTEATARSHVVAAVDYTPILAFCAMSGFGERPRSHRLLQRMRWIVHEEFEPADRAPHRHYSFSPGLPGVHGGAMAINVPFPSGAAHERKALPNLMPQPWRFGFGSGGSGGSVGMAAVGDRSRPYLLSYSGSLNGSPENRKLRAAVARQCHAHGGALCRMNKITQGLALDSDGAADFYAVKRESVFCAEPGGHNRIRKGIADAVLCGCIPVLFLRPDERRRLWPLHWFGWRNDSTLMLDPAAFLSRDLDLVELLRRVPRERVTDMQRSLAQNAHRLAYLVEKEYEGDDAIDVMLKGMAFGLPGG